MCWRVGSVSDGERVRLARNDWPRIVDWRRRSWRRNSNDLREEMRCTVEVVVGALVVVEVVSEVGHADELPEVLGWQILKG